MAEDDDELDQKDAEEIFKAAQSDVLTMVTEIPKFLHEYGKELGTIAYTKSLVARCPHGGEDQRAKWMASRLSVVLGLLYVTSMVSAAELAEQLTSRKN